MGFPSFLMTECHGLMMDWMWAVREKEESKLIPRDVYPTTAKVDLWFIKLGIIVEKSEFGLRFVHQNVI